MRNDFPTSAVEPKLDYPWRHKSYGQPRSHSRVDNGRCVPVAEAGLILMGALPR